MEVTDAEWGELRLSVGGRTVVTRESLSEFTTAVAMSRCDDKRVTRRIMERAGVRVARGALAGESRLEDAATLVREVGAVVVKPARGEQGAQLVAAAEQPPSRLRHRPHLTFRRPRRTPPGGVPRPRSY